MRTAAAVCAAVALLLAQANSGRADDWVQATGPSAPGIVAARYSAPDDVYPHRIMGDIREKRVLAVKDARGRVHKVDLRKSGDGTHVFEDIAPRVVDADGDGARDAVVVETDPQLGAQLAVYGLRQNRLVKIAATPHIGTRFRWLAPVAVADLDGNGVVDLAYVETPHLGKRLRVWSWAPGGLTEIARLDGVTNHRIGETDIAGGLRDCGDGPEMILASADWRDLVAVRLTASGLEQRRIGPHKGRGSFSRALQCQGS